jgi:hypothetical protein
MALCLGVLAVGAIPAHAASGVEPFFGQWSGKATRSDGAAGAAASPADQRDIMLTISAHDGDGFQTSALAALGAGDPEADADFRQTTLNFRPAPGGGWQAQKACADPREVPCAWAHLEGNTLTTSAIGILDNGAVEVQVAKRVLQGGGMAIEYIRLVDGKVSRMLTGRLVKLTP